MEASEIAGQRKRQVDEADGADESYQPGPRMVRHRFGCLFAPGPRYRSQLYFGSNKQSVLCRSDFQRQQVSTGERGGWEKVISSTIKLLKFRRFGRVLTPFTYYQHHIISETR